MRTPGCQLLGSSALLFWGSPERKHPIASFNRHLVGAVLRAIIVLFFQKGGIFFQDTRKVGERRSETTTKGRKKMRKQMNYETFLQVANTISHSKEPEEVALMTVEGIKTALDIKGCALLLLDQASNELQVAASYGLSDEYLNKGPLSALHSIAQSLGEGPIAIANVADDPRLQYPEEAQREGIASILSVPVQVNQKLMGALRVYTSEPWEFTLDDVNFVSALAQIAGMSIRLARYSKGLLTSIEVLKDMQEVRVRRSTRRTPYEGVPVSFAVDETGRV
jgi:signal transduction protein with GAF and PtsI domain